MISIKDGRSELYQWDTGRVVTVPAECSQVHFSNKFFGRSIDVDVVNGEALIPDILLQSDKELEVWAFVGTAENGYTKISKTFKVNRRNKPSDYVFTPSEQITAEDIIKKANEAIDDARRSATSAAKSAEDAESAKTDVEASAQRAAVSEGEAHVHATRASSEAEKASASATEAKDAYAKIPKISGTPAVGQIFRVSAVGDGGKVTVEPTDMPDVYITANDVASALGYTPANEEDVAQVKEALEKKVPFRYITLTIKSTEGDTDIPTTITTSIGGAVYSTVAYAGTPVALAIPDGAAYKITASSEVHHGDAFYYNPTALEGVAMADAQAEVVYSKLGAIHSFADVKRISDMGLAPQYFQVGDVLTTTYTDVNGTEYECPWIVVSTEGATLADGTVKESGVHLQIQYASIESIQYDAPEKEKATEETAQEGLYYYGFDGTNYTLLTLSTGDPIPYSDYTEIYHKAVKDTTVNIVRYGYNRPSHSAQEQWVNSTAGKGEWWEAKHVGDTPPAELARYRGFLAGFDADFLGALAEIQITRALNTVSEPDKTLKSETRNVRMYLPSLEQMYIVPQADGVEGDFWPYYKQLAEDNGRTGKYAGGGTYPELASTALNAQSSAQSVRLGSCSRGNSYNQWIVNSSGIVNNSSANNSYRARPACFI